MKEKKNKLVFMMQYDQEGIAVDPNGSYTGVCKDPLDTPVQDADDL